MLWENDSVDSFDYNIFWLIHSIQLQQVRTFELCFDDYGETGLFLLPLKGPTIALIAMTTYKKTLKIVILGDSG